MGGDNRAAHRANRGDVSTHAPAWGATHQAKEEIFRDIVSTHAPAWGATIWQGDYKPSYLFQLTPPHGGRQVTSMFLL